MFVHHHPYEPFIFTEATKLIVGTLPPPRFSEGTLKEGDVDFCYGSRDGQLWRILDAIFDLGLHYENTQRAIEERQHFLLNRKIGICDIVARAHREEVNASDQGMKQVILRDLLGYLHRYPNIETLLFTGGNSMNGPEYFCRKLLKKHQIEFALVHPSIPRIHEFVLPQNGQIGRTIRTVSLTAPSGSANRAVGGLPEYKKRKTADPHYTTLDFRIDQYRPYF